MTSEVEHAAPLELEVTTCVQCGEAWGSDHGAFIAVISYKVLRNSLEERSLLAKRAEDLAAI